MTWRILLLGVLGVLIVLVALPWLGPLAGLDGHRDSVPPAARRVEIGDGLHLNVVVRGEGAPLVLVHGLPGDTAQLGSLAETLARDGHRAITYDRLGWGHSSRRPADRPATIAENSREFVALLDALGLERSSWLGFSYGGGVVQEAARQHPQRVDHLVLLASVGPAQERADPGLLGRVLFSPPVLGWALSTGPTARAFSGGAMQSLFAPEMDPPAAIVDRMLGYASLPGVPTTWVREARAPRAYGTAPILAPTLVIHGDGDRAVPLEVGRDLHERIPRSHLVVLSGGSHALPLTRPDELSSRVSEFLAGAQSGSQ